MEKLDNVTFKIANKDWEFEQIHSLNYRTFVEEIPQHQKNESKQLVDRFHDQNDYIIAIYNHNIIAMVAIRDQRPFSLDQKLPELDTYLPRYQSIVEIRLLVIEKEYRKSAVFMNLMIRLLEECNNREYDIAIISGTTRELKLYQLLGFKPFAHPVGAEDALYQPMYIDRETYQQVETYERIFKKFGYLSSTQEVFNYLPGPVSFRPELKDHFTKSPISHRKNLFVEDFNNLRALLCQQLNADYVQVVTGSGTLANDIVAQYIKTLDQPGLILCNGEFGRRLTDHANRINLDFEVVALEDGEGFSEAYLEKIFKEHDSIGWLWMAHCETSTGVLNPLQSINKLCLHNGIKLCVDAISSVACVPVSFKNVWMATAVSGKGIGALPGLSLVFHQEDILSGWKDLPRYMDLANYEKNKGLPFTISSNVVYALICALDNIDWQAHFQHTSETSKRLIEQILDRDLTLVADTHYQSPHVITIKLSPAISSVLIGEYMESKGFQLSYNSYYLRKSNYLQICLMGNFSPPSKQLINQLADKLQSMELASGIAS